MAYESAKRNRYFEPPGSDFPDTNRNHWQDFNEYHAPNARMHHANLHDWGIARGLEVTGTIGSPSITIEPGVAIDKQGRLFALATNGRGDVRINQSDAEVPSNVPVQLNIDSRFSSQTLYLTIQFSERLRPESGTAGGRFEQVPWIRLQPVTGTGPYVDDGNSIILAIAVVDATGKLAELKEKDPNLSFRRRLIGEEIEELRFRRAIKDDGGVKETIDTVLLPVNGGGLQANILGKPALQIFAPDQKNTYLTLLNLNGQQAIQLDTTTGAGSVRIKNVDDKGIGAFQTSDDGSGLLSLYNKTGERATIELFADQGESGVLKLFGADGSEKLQLSESGINTAGTVTADNISSTGFVSSSSIFASNISASSISASNVSTSNISVSKISGFTSDGVAINNGNSFYGGTLTLNKSDGNVAGWFWVPDGNRGQITLFGADGNRIDIGGGNISANQVFANNFGQITVNKSDGNPAVWLFAADGNNGWLTLFSSNNQRKIQLEGGSGRIFCEEIYARGVKPFIIDHPEDRTKNIIYAAIEGPEAAAYIRGRAQLIGGQAEIEFPEHFTLVVNPETITIQLTPRSADSKGLAVIAQSERGFSVKELWQGEGNYEFDYFVAGVRRGMEHFTPVVDKGFTAFGEPMGMTVSGSPAAPQPVSMIQEVVPSSSAQPVESSGAPAPPVSIGSEPSPISPTEPQAAGSGDVMSELPMPTISSIPSPPAINFSDKQP